MYLPLVISLQPAVSTGQIDLVGGQSVWRGAKLWTFFLNARVRDRAAFTDRETIAYTDRKTKAHTDRETAVYKGRTVRRRGWNLRRGQEGERTRERWSRSQISQTPPPSNLEILI